MKKPINYYYYYFPGALPNDVPADEINQVLSFITTFNNFVFDCSKQVKAIELNEKIDTVINKDNRSKSEKYSNAKTLHNHSEEVYVKVKSTLSDLKAILLIPEKKHSFYIDLSHAGLTGTGLSLKINTFSSFLEKPNKNNISSLLELGNAILDSILEVILATLEKRFGLTIHALKELANLLLTGFKKYLKSIIIRNNY